MTTRRALRRMGSITLLLVMLGAPTASAEWQIKPFVGATYGGESTFLFVPSSNQAHLSYGASALWLGEVLGVEADFGHTLRFFQTSLAGAEDGDGSVYTITGNVVVAMPRRLTQYTLRPYVVGGAGLIHVAYDTTLLNPFVSEQLKAMDLGAGVTGFITRHFGVSWDVRYFRSIDRTIEKGYSIGPERLSFWRATMAVAIKL